jgi:hypothetical protein
MLVLVSGIAGFGAAFGAGACGGDDRGAVTIQGATTGTTATTPATTPATTETTP